MADSRIKFDRYVGTYARRLDTMRASAVRDLFAAASRSDIISLSGGMPDISVHLILCFCQCLLHQCLRLLLVKML
ncbi:MAG: hypothetical protein ACI4OC_01060 [Coriobacteriales bacterium]